MLTHTHIKSGVSIIIRTYVEHDARASDTIIDNKAITYPT